MKTRTAAAVATLSPTEQRFAALIVEALGSIAADEQLDEGELRRRLYRVLRSAGLQERRAPQARIDLARVLGPALADVDPVPYATVEQARRLAELRAALLRSGAFSTAALADARAMTPNTARQWTSRHRRADRLFTVSHDGETLVPAFLLDEQLEPRSAAEPAIAALRAAGEDGWALWAWFALPSSWLGGRVPAEVLGTEPGLVVEAARARAAAAA